VPIAERNDTPFRGHQLRDTAAAIISLPDVNIITSAVTIMTTPPARSTRARAHFNNTDHGGGDMPQYLGNDSMPGRLCRLNISANLGRLSELERHPVGDKIAKVLLNKHSTTPHISKSLVRSNLHRNNPAAMSGQLVIKQTPQVPIGTEQEGTRGKPHSFANICGIRVDGGPATLTRTDVLQEGHHSLQFTAADSLPGPSKGASQVTLRLTDEPALLVK